VGDQRVVERLRAVPIGASEEVVKDLEACPVTLDSSRANATQKAVHRLRLVDTDTEEGLEALPS
jgi:hypothetical protein